MAELCRIAGLWCFVIAILCLALLVLRLLASLAHGVARLPSTRLARGSYSAWRRFHDCPADDHRDTIEANYGHLRLRCVDCRRSTEVGLIFPSQYCHTQLRGSV